MIKTCLIASAVLFSCQPAFAAADISIKNKSLPEVVVTAKKEKTSLTVPGKAEARAEIQRVPGGASLVDSETYKTGRATTLQDALGYTPGVYVQPRYGGEEARLSIRGSGIQRTFQLRGIKILQDGIPLNQADGGADFQAIDPLALQYIEVLRGANALEYGSTTLGGAINLVSPTGYDASALQGRFEIGSFNYLREQVSSGAAQGPFDYFVSLSEARQDGFRNHGQQWTRRLFSNYGLRLSENAETRFYVNLTDSKSKIPGNLTASQMDQNPKQNALTNVTGNQKRDFDLIQIANKTAFYWDEQSLALGAFYARKDLFNPLFRFIDQITDDFGGSIRYRNRADLLERKNIFTVGFNPAWNIADGEVHANNGGERGALTVKLRQHSYNVDFYGENQFYLFERLALSGGAQWSFASRKSRDKLLVDGDHSGHPTYHGISPKAGLRYEFTETNQLFANFSRSFEPPSFGELSSIFNGAITAVDEQTASTVEIGTRGEKQRLSWDAAYYYSWVNRELLSLLDTNGAPLGTVNADETRHQGAELGLGLDILRNLLREKDRVLLRGIYNWSRFRFANDRVFSDNALPGIPEHFTRLELLYEHPQGFYLGPNIEAAPRGYAVDMNNTLFTNPYILFGLKAGWRRAKGISFFIEAKNLSNQTYSTTTGVIADAARRDSAQFLPGDGRSLFSGIEFEW